MKVFGKANSGFTLLEVLITIIIAAVLLSTVLFTFIAAGQNTMRNRNRIIALSHATSTLEFLRNFVTGDPTGTKYRLPGTTTYALAQSAATPYNLDIDYETSYYTTGRPRSFIGPSTLVGAAGTAGAPFVRQYTVTDVPITAFPNGQPFPAGITIKRVTVTIRKQ